MIQHGTPRLWTMEEEEREACGAVRAENGEVRSRMQHF